jgi:hypothetical protein
MGGEFISAPGNGGGSYQIEHDVTRTIHGDVESVRARLSDALEQLGYRVLNEAPLQARRSGTTAGAAGCATDVRESPTSVTIGLKSLGAHSSRVTVSYVVRNPYGCLSRGDRATLEREAEAAIALAQMHHHLSACASCGAELGGATRFCRQCGAPATPVAPAELKVYQLTADVNSGYKWAFWSLMFLLTTALLPLLLLLGSDNPAKFAKLVKIVGFLCAMFGAGGFWFLGMGLHRLRKSLLPDAEPAPLAAPPRRNPGALSPPDTNELAPASASPSIPTGHSITENTTDLLPQEVRPLKH